MINELAPEPELISSMTNRKNNRQRFRANQEGFFFVSHCVLCGFSFLFYFRLKNIADPITDQPVFEIPCVADLDRADHSVDQ